MAQTMLHKLKLKTYFDNLAEKKGFGSDPTIVRLWNLIGYITVELFVNALIELGMVIIFWVLLSKIGQGRDIIVGMFEKDGTYGIERLYFTLASIVLFSITMWIIPAKLMYRSGKRNEYKVDYIPPLERHIFWFHRILPMLPFWVFASVLFTGSGWIFISVSIIMLILFYRIHNIERLKQWRNRLLVIASAIVLISLYFLNKYYVVTKPGQETYKLLKIIYSICLYGLSAFLYMIYYKVDKIISSDYFKKETDLPVKKKFFINTTLYQVLFFIHLSVFLIIIQHGYELETAPESLLLFIFAFYVFIFDLIAYISQVSTFLKRMLQFIGLAIFINAVIFGNLNLTHFKIDEVVEISAYIGKTRESFDSRLKNFLTAAKLTGDTGVYPIVLVAGEGGGSKAALWFSQNLLNLDSATGGKFRKHIFSVSTVSGSSVGLELMMAYWSSLMPGDTSQMHLWRKAPFELYTKNYVSSSIKGLFFNDFFKAYVPGFNWVSDKNTDLQNEEVIRMNEVIKNLGIRCKKDLNRIDFMTMLYEKAGEHKNSVPMMLINTCRTNDGKRGIISSIELDDRNWLDAVDVTGFLYQDTGRTYMKNDKPTRKPWENAPAHPISFEQACNMSELFPLFSSPIWIDGLGYFVDGGYHENSGLKTTLEVYQQLKEAPEYDSTKYPIYILYFKNSSIEKNMYKTYEQTMSVIQPAKALIQQPFGGLESYFETKAGLLDDNFIMLNINKDTMQASLRKIDADIEDELLLSPESDTSVHKTAYDFPLARWLSKIVAGLIYNRANEELGKNLQLKKLVNQVNSSK